MTGWMLLAAFLATYLPGHGVPAVLWGGWPQLAAAVIAVASAPFIGFVIGAILQWFYYKVWGHPYTGEARRRVQQWSTENEALNGEERKLLKDMNADDVFAYFYCMHAPSHFIDMNRRRRTTQFMSYNWCFAAAIGVISGLAPDLRWQKLASVIVVATVVVIVLLLGRRAKQEADGMELLWAQEFLRNPPPELRKGGNA